MSKNVYIVKVGDPTTGTCRSDAEADAIAAKIKAALIAAGHDDEVVAVPYYVQVEPIYGADLTKVFSFDTGARLNEARIPHIDHGIQAIPYQPTRTAPVPVQVPAPSWMTTECGSTIIGAPNARPQT